MSKSEITPLTKSSIITDETSSKIFNSVISLLRSPVDIHITYVILMITLLSTNGVFFTLSLYLIDVLGVADSTAGYMNTAIGIIVLITRLPIGAMIQSINVKNAYILGSGVLVIFFLTFAWVDILWIQISSLLFLFIFGWSIMFIATTIGLNNILTPETRSIGFSISISLKFLAALIFGLTFQWIFSTYGESRSSFKILFTILAFLNMVSFVLSFWLNKEVIGGQNCDKDMNVISSLNESLSEKRFWRLLIYVVLLAVPMAAFNQAVVILPIQIEREISGGTFYGWLLALRSVSSAIFCVTSTVLVYYLEIYNSMTLSSLLLSVSVLVFAFGTEFWAIMIYVIISSLANSILEPRLFEYTANISPAGKEWIYLTITSTNFSLSILFAGFTSSFVLDEFCPKDGERDCWVMWYVVAVVTFVATIFIASFKRCLQEP